MDYSPMEDVPYSKAERLEEVRRMEHIVSELRKLADSLDEKYTFDDLSVYSSPVIVLMQDYLQRRLRQWVKAKVIALKQSVLIHEDVGWLYKMYASPKPEVDTSLTFQSGMIQR